LELIDCEFDETLLRLVRMKARQLVGNFGLRWDDVEDITNELCLDWLKHSRRFRPERSSRRTFQNRIINNAVVDLVRKRKTQLRGYGIAIVPLEHIHYDFAASNDTESDDRDRRLDALKAVHRMPPELIPVALTLMQTDSNSETAHQLGISRASLYRSIDKIRGFFEQAGLRPSSRRKTEQKRKVRPHNRRPVRRTPN
jgi:RNA polymerase sigma factor (sigma-70 family)